MFFIINQPYITSCLQSYLIVISELFFVNHSVQWHYFCITLIYPEKAGSSFSFRLPFLRINYLDKLLLRNFDLKPYFTTLKMKIPIPLNYIYKRTGTLIKKLYLFTVIIMIFTVITGCGDRVIAPSDVTYDNTDITIAGTVTNSDMPVPAAYVRLYLIKGQPSRFISSKSTDLAGRYIFTNLSAGTYRVEAWYNKSLYERGQDCTGGNNINAAGPGKYISYIVNGAVAPKPQITPVVKK